MYHQSRSVILRNRDLRESDQLLTIFSEQEGKITAVAKGVKKAKSSLRGCVQPFCHSLLFFNRGRDMDLITQGKIIDFFGNSREDINRILYATLVSVLELINEQGLNLMLVRYFESQLLVNLGYRPVMDQCVLCGSLELSDFKFSLSEGGLLCSSCGRAGDSVISLGGESVALIKLLCDGKLQTVQRVKASPRAMQQVEFFLERYLEYHLERRFKVKNTIRWLKQAVPVSN